MNYHNVSVDAYMAADPGARLQDVRDVWPDDEGWPGDYQPPPPKPMKLDPLWPDYRPPVDWLDEGWHLYRGPRSTQRLSAAAKRRRRLRRITERLPSPPPAPKPQEVFDALGRRLPLVRVALPNQDAPPGLVQLTVEQQQRGYILTTEPCPCGSGRPFGVCHYHPFDPQKT